MLGMIHRAACRRMSTGAKMIMVGTYDVEDDVRLGSFFFEELLVFQVSDHSAYAELLLEDLRFALVADEKCDLVMRVIQ